MIKANRASSNKQRQLIAIACGQLAISREDKSAMLMERYGKASTTELTFAQAEQVIDDLRDQGFVIKSNKRRYLSRHRPIPGSRKGKAGNMVAMATQAELAKIDALAGLIAWRVENGLERWMEKRFRITQVKTSCEAFKVIEGLKGMFENQMKQQYGPDWWQEPYDDTEVCFYIAEHHPMMVGGSVVPAYARVRDLGMTGNLRGAL